MRSEGFRWALCAAAVAAAHGCAFLVLTAPNVNIESDAGSPIVTLELSPISAAPTPPQEDAQADAPPDAQVAPATPVVQAALPPPAPTPDPAPPVAQAQPTPEPRPDPTPPPPPEPVPTQAANDPNPPPPATPATPDSASAAPPPPAPAKELPTVVETPAPTPPLPPPSAPSVEAAATADVATAPTLSPGREETVSPAALRSWQRELIAQIERHKWFPASAVGRSGVASVAFSIDRSGRLTKVRILASSGSAAFDEAALDLIRRSQPFPMPPAALRESDLSFVAPVRYLPSATR